MLTTITLPPEYDDLPESARLWLQTLYGHPPEKREKQHSYDESQSGAAAEDLAGDDNDDAKVDDDDDAKVDDDDDHSSTPAEHDQTGPCSSAPSKTDIFLESCVTRPFTLRSFIEAFDMVCMVIPRAQVILLPKYRYLLPLVVIRLVELLFSSVAGAMGLWAKARLMSTVADSFVTGHPVLLRDAAWSIAAAATLAAVEIISDGHF
ncbi:uncharacterized protein LOC62_04G005219 [Vanrija pseudolonga]|uniref:Uncharacterized protein n=1 Tax=Vanrija pseudolonga TaxID=143232 RepID=A0AAF0Y7V3_9TREE|nr:hypothetical protein LOC62_04G005219 [Vanrija pseudolonga]